jgi:hypothetical protein
MYLRRINRKKSGKDHYYWALVESYRTDKGSRQRIIGYIGDVASRQAKKIAQAADASCESVQQDFFSPEELPEIATIEPRKTRTERQRQFGGVWLGNKLFETLGVDDYFRGHLEDNDKSSSWHDIIKILVISRFYNPSSELYIAEHLYEHSAMEDFFGIPAERIYDNRLYRGLDKLLPHKDGLQKHLKERLGRLFDLEYDLFLYDVTSTYVEGDHASSTLCKRAVTKNDTASHWLRQTEGHYLLRTNITDWEAKNLWEAYIHLTGAEEAFRIHKSDLHLRPLWHQKDDRIKAHIFVCFFAFVLWKTFGLMCKRAGLGDEPRRVFDEIKKICMVDVVLTTTEGKELKIRTVPRPDKPLQILLHKLGLRLPERLTKRIL